MGHSEGVLRDLLVLSVTSHSIGIETHDGAMEKLLRRNYTVPTKATTEFATYMDGIETDLPVIASEDRDNDSVTIRIYEGEQTVARDNTFIGQFRLSGLSRGALGHSVIQVTMDIESNGVLSVCAVEKHTEVKADYVVGRYPLLEILNLKRSANELQHLSLDHPPESRVF